MTTVKSFHSLFHFLDLHFIVQYAYIFITIFYIIININHNFTLCSYFIHNFEVYLIHTKQHEMSCNYYTHR